MSIGQQVEMSVGPFYVSTTTNGGHPPEFFAERICERLIYISENAPPEIKMQALAYQEALKATVLDGIKRAIVSNHTTMIYQLRKAGKEEAAALVLEMRS